MGFMTHAQRKFVILLPVILLLIAASPPLSRAVETNQTTPLSIRRDVELQALQNALKAFGSGDYGKAQHNFEMLGGVAKNPDIRREALYGLAATRLVLAASEDAYDCAVAAWEKWAGEARSPGGTEDPGMITPFLLRLQSAIRKGGGGPLGAKAKHEAFPRINVTREKEVQALRSKLAIAERQIRRLRHDLKSLDEIHRKYERKKQETTP